MLTLEEIKDLAAWRVLSPSGKEYIQHAVTSQPSRAVGFGGLLNQSGAFCSAAGYTLQWESRSVELVFVHHTELESGLLGVWDQPPKLAVIRHDKKGRRLPGEWTPDYLTLRSDRFRLTECKPLAEVRSLEESRPTDWASSTNGEPCWKPGENVCASLGAQFELFHSGMYTPVIAANLRVLVTASREALSEAEKRALAMVRECLIDRPLTHGEILQRFARVNGELLLRGLIAAEVHGALSTSLIGETFIYYANQAEALAREGLIVNARARSDRPLGAYARRLVCASGSELVHAEAALAEYNGARSSGAPMSSTDYRLRTHLEKAKEEGAPALCAFIRRTGDRGRKPCIPETAFTLMAEAAREHIENTPKPELSTAYAEFLTKAKEKGEYTPVLETFRKTYNAVLTPEKRALATRGKRGFHAERPCTDPRTRCVEAPIPGIFAHIDCTPSDVVAVDDDEIGDCPRAILIPLVEQESGYVFGRGYLFGNVSKIAPALALCDAVARHGSLPANISYDGGSEFNNDYLSSTLAKLGVNAVYRPKSAPQWGSRVESFQGQFGSFVQKIQGGLANDKIGRASDGKKKGRKNAIHKIGEIIATSDDWIFNISNRSPFKDETASPEDIVEQGRRAFPSGCVRIVDDRAFRIITAIPIPLRRDTWDRKKGIRYGGARFSSKELCAAHLRGARLTSVGLDARDPTIVYASTSFGVIDAFSARHEELQGESEPTKLAHHATLIGYHARARENQIAKKCKEAAILKSLRDASRFNNTDKRQRDNAKSAQQDAQDEDDFDSIDVSTVEEFETR